MTDQTPLTRWLDQLIKASEYACAKTAHDSLQSLLDQFPREQWRPIAEAPKDGTGVLLYWPYWTADPVIGFCDGLGDWQCERNLANDGPGPTHWMPLPPPPASEAEEED